MDTDADRNLHGHIYCDADATCCLYRHADTDGDADPYGHAYRDGDTYHHFYRHACPAYGHADASVSVPD
jgi:hypothetical protein